MKNDALLSWSTLFFRHNHFIFSRKAIFLIFAARSCIILTHFPFYPGNKFEIFPGRVSFIPRNHGVFSVPSVGNIRSCACTECFPVRSNVLCCLIPFLYCLLLDNILTVMFVHISTEGKTILSSPCLFLHISQQITTHWKARIFKEETGC